MGELTRGLLDTSILIALDEGGHLGDILPEALAISVATLAELHYGVLVAKNNSLRQQRLQRLGVIEATFEPIPLDAEVARAYAAVAHTLKTFGRKPSARVMDLWIAATALAKKIPLLTQNVADFEGLEELIEIRKL
jgi:predicted nucleic acid-binding protein